MPCYSKLMPVSDVSIGNMSFKVRPTFTSVLYHDEVVSTNDPFQHRPLNQLSVALKPFSFDLFYIFEEKHSKRRVILQKKKKKEPQIGTILELSFTKINH